jgi:hypothetical protein
MLSKIQYECIHQLMVRVRSNDRSVFGGALVVLLGDMGQTLPVLPRAWPAGSIAACIMSWSRWEDVVLLQLATNERIQQHLLRGDSSAGQAAGWCAALDNIACARDSADAYVGSATRHYSEEGVRIMTNERTSSLTTVLPTLQR